LEAHFKDNDTGKTLFVVPEYERCHQSRVGECVELLAKDGNPMYVVKNIVAHVVAHHGMMGRDVRVSAARQGISVFVERLPEDVPA
jgi:hypothetical protein